MVNPKKNVDDAEQTVVEMKEKHAQLKTAMSRTQTNKVKKADNQVSQGERAVR